MKVLPSDIQGLPYSSFLQGCADGIQGDLQYWGLSLCFLQAKNTLYPFEASPWSSRISLLNIENF